MKKPPKKPDQNLNSNNKNGLRRRILITILSVLLLSMGGGFTYGWFLLTRKLPPIAEKELTKLLKRPVNIGEVKGLSFGGVSFATSEIPATATDSNRVTIETVNVGINPVKLLLDNKLELNITLVKPELYLQQDTQRKWVSTDINATPGGEGLKVELQTLRIKDAEVTLVARSVTGNLKPPVEINVSRATGRILQNLITFELTGKLEKGGELKLVDSQWNISTNEMNLGIKGKELAVTEISNLLPLPLDLQAGTADGNLTINLKNWKVENWQGNTYVNNVTFEIPVVFQPFTQTTGNLLFKGSEIEFDNVSTIFGLIPGKAQGIIDTKKDYNLLIKTEPVQTEAVIKTLLLPQPPIPISGEIKGEIKVTGLLLNPLIDFDVTTTKTATIDKVEFNSVKANLQLKEYTLFIQQMQAIPGVGGEIKGEGKIELEDFSYLFELQANNVPTDKIAEVYQTILPFNLGKISGKTQISGFLNQPESITATGTATAGGFTAKNFKLKQGNWETILTAENLKTSELFPEILPQLAGEINGNLNLGGKWGDWENIKGNGTANLTATGGKVTAKNLEVAQGGFSTILVSEGIELKNFSEEFRGKLSGELKVNGELANLNLNSMKAKGELNFSEGISLLERPLTTVINWTGEKIEVREIKGKGVSGSGIIELNLDGKTTDLIQELDLDIKAEEIKLELLPIPGLELAKIQLLGTTDFTGKIIGNPNTPKVNGNLNLHNFAITGTQKAGSSLKDSFATLLTGKIEIIPAEKVELKLIGDTDKIEILLDETNQPETFFIQQNERSYKGLRKGEILQVEAKNVPLSLIKNYTLQHLPDEEVSQITDTSIGGKLDGEININLNTKATIAKVEVEKPVLGRVTGDRFFGTLKYINDTYSVTQGKLTKGKSEYLLNGSWGETNPLIASVEIVEGEIQDILETLEIFEISDLIKQIYSKKYSKTSELYSDGEENEKQPLFRVGLPGKTILEQLGLLAQIQTEVEEKESKKEADTLPKLANLKGTINGIISVEGKEKEITEAKFDLKGKQWEWEEYKINEAIAAGNYKNGLINLQPIKIEVGENSQISLKGNFGGENQNGELLLTNIPIELIQNYLPSAIEIGGMLNGNVEFTGSKDNPIATGEIIINQATINQKSIKSTQGKFNYQNARFNFVFQSFGSEEHIVLPDINWQLGDINYNEKVVQDAPLLITGSFPYQLPFGSVKPQNKQLNLKINIKDTGLDLLSILSKNQINWVEGKGEIKLDIEGIFNQEKLQIEQLTTLGSAKIENATITAQFFPTDSFTEVNGDIEFNFDRINIKNIKGKFSGGEIQATGILPLNQTTPQEKPLTINLENIVLNFKRIYQGSVEGNIDITGTLFEPDIGGKLKLFNGKLQLTPTDTVTGINTDINTNFNYIPELNNLKLTLGENLQIIQIPILNFFAKGTLNLKGNIFEPLPEGNIELQGGQVNLFASQLRLEESAKNTAKFLPDRGLDPYLNIQLVGSVSETNRNQIPLDPLSPEIKDIPQESIGTLQTIRIEANVNGFASQLNNNIDLSSSPPRSQQEIIALLGGGFINNFGSGESTLGLANLAGEVFFGSFQGEVADAFGLSQFSIFPTRIIEENKRTATLGLGGEIGIDIADRFSFSILKILTNEQEPQFGFRYRLNDKIILRGSSNFENESRGVIEYQQRF